MLAGLPIMFENPESDLCFAPFLQENLEKDNILGLTYWKSHSSPLDKFVKQ